MSAADGTSVQERTDKLEGLGCKRKRVEDARFTQGKGRYVDDISCPAWCSAISSARPHGHARIKAIDKSKALALPGVKAVLTADDLKPLNLHYMPTLAGDVQAVLAVDKVLFQGQRSPSSSPPDRYIAADAVELVEVEYEDLPCVIDPLKAMDKDAPVLRHDLEGKTEGAHGARRHHNHIFTWEVGDAAATNKALGSAEVVAKESSPISASIPVRWRPVAASLPWTRSTALSPSGAPSRRRMRCAPWRPSSPAYPSTRSESSRRISAAASATRSGSIRGYICSIVASIVLGVPVKWIEDRIENLTATAFARDYHMTGEIAATKDARITALKCHVVADHGAFDACADPTKFPGRLLQHLHRLLRHPDRLPLGRWASTPTRRRARRLSLLLPGDRGLVFYRAHDGCAGPQAEHGSGRGARKNFIRKEQFPYTSALGWEYDSGDYDTAFDKALKAWTTRACAKSRRRIATLSPRRDAQPDEHRHRFFTEIVGRGPVKNCDILGLGMFDSCEIRIHPTGSAIARLGTISQGQGHATTFAQILATEIGLPASMITVEEGDTDTAPYGLGTYGSRSTPVAGAATAMAGRKIRAKAQMIAAYLLEVHDSDLEWDVDRFQVKGAPDRFKTMKEIAFAAYNKAIPGSSRAWRRSRITTRRT